MPNLRYQTLRRKPIGQQDINDTAKLRAIKALYLVVFNDDKPILLQATELFHILGSILEGTPPETLELYNINKQDFLATYADLSNK